LVLHFFTPAQESLLHVSWRDLTEQLNELRGLEPSPRKATSLFYGIGVLLRLYETLVLDRRLTEIEAFLGVEVQSWLWTRERLP